MMAWNTFWVAHSEWLLPLLIVAARVVDVSLGTLRVLFLARGHRVLAPLVGFFEVLVWLLAVMQIIGHVNSFWSYVAYPAGFSLGTVLGMYLEERLALGHVAVRVIPQRRTEELVKSLRETGYGATTVDAQGAKGPVQIVFALVPRRDLMHALALVRQFNPMAFYTVEDVRVAHQGIRPQVFRSR